MGTSVDVTGRGSLDWWSFDRSIVASPSSQDELYLNLSGLRFIDPYALVGLTCLVDAAATFDVPISVAEPRDSSVASYLHRAGLGDVLEAAGVDEHGLPSVNRRDTNRLLELVRFDAAGVNRLGRMISMALIEQGVNQGVAGRVSSAIWEAGDNVHTHADAAHGGVACAQLYRADSTSPYVVWAVGDAGMGVRSSLAQRYDVADDMHALWTAIKPGITTVDDARGLGLGAVIDLMVDAQNATVYLRSGQARMTAAPKVKEVDSVPLVQGTILAGRIDCSGLITDPGDWQWSS
jgi:hypothetical protein